MSKKGSSAAHVLVTKPPTPRRSSKMFPKRPVDRIDNAVNVDVANRAEAERFAQTLIKNRSTVHTVSWSEGRLLILQGAAAVVTEPALPDEATAPLVRIQRLMLAGAGTLSVAILRSDPRAEALLQILSAGLQQLVNEPYEPATDLPSGKGVRTPDEATIGSAAWEAGFGDEEKDSVENVVDSEG